MKYLEYALRFNRDFPVGSPQAEAFTPERFGKWCKEVGIRLYEGQSRSWALNTMRININRAAVSPTMFESHRASTFVIDVVQNGQWRVIRPEDAPSNPRNLLRVVVGLDRHIKLAEIQFAAVDWTRVDIAKLRSPYLNYIGLLKPLREMAGQITTEAQAQRNKIEYARQQQLALPPPKKERKGKPPSRKAA